ncbi:MAG: hypothetical protein MJZ18_11280 [Bacteroidales bacterium]|nr:hypothetical protein [Bacteroidales bacterium]
MEIKPKYGFDKVHFGLTIAQAKAILGEPEEVDADQNFSEEPDDLTTVLYYDGYSLSFDKKVGYRLTEMPFEDESFKLGKIAVGMAEEKVVELAEGMDLGDWEDPFVDDDSNDPDFADTTGYAFEDSCLSLLCTAGNLTEIEIYVPLDENDQPVWPDVK